MGTVLEFRIRTTDYHDKETLSEIIKVPVQADQPPTIAISHPIEGASYIAGQSIELRANATDDVRIDRVDFYVDDRIVGSVRKAPYAYLWDTQAGALPEKPFSVHAVVVCIAQP